MKTLERITALLAAIIMVMTLAACTDGKKPAPVNTAPAVTEDSSDNTELAVTPETEARINELAPAIALFGEFSMEDGISMHSLAEMVYCRYTMTLKESSRKGFGKINADEAAAEVGSMFGFGELRIMIPKYREDEDQDYYLDGDDCFIRLSDPNDCRVSIVSIDPCELSGSRAGLRVMAEVELAGEDPFTMVMRFTTGRDGKLCVDSCEKHYAM